MPDLNESFEQAKRAEQERNFDVPLTKPKEEAGKMVFDRDPPKSTEGRVPWENKPGSKLDSCF